MLGYFSCIPYHGCRTHHQRERTRPPSQLANKLPARASEGYRSRYPWWRGGGDQMTEGVRRAWHGIEVRHLAALQALAEEASFQRAARRLGYSQPAVSQQLAALERIVGAQLVNRPRVSHPLTLTEMGKRLLVHAKAIQANLAIAEAELVGVGEAAQLRVGAYQT